jgi:hypothetical protein
VPRAEGLPLARQPRRTLLKLNGVRGPVKTDSSSTVGSNEIDDSYRNLPWHRLIFPDAPSCSWIRRSASHSDVMLEAS